MTTLAHDVGGPLLALDTSTSTCSLALVDPARRPAATELQLPAQSLPAEHLVHGLNELLVRHRLAPGALRAVVVGLGPGSYTGLRVGLATVKGLALGAEVPVYGVSSLALLAASAGPGVRVPVIDARRGDVYRAVYETFVAQAPVARRGDAVLPAAECLAELRALGCASVAGPPLVGDWAAPATAALGAGTVVSATPRALWAPLLCADALRRGGGTPLATLTPHYLRASAAAAGR